MAAVNAECCDPNCAYLELFKVLHGYSAICEAGEFNRHISSVPTVSVQGAEVAESSALTLITCIEPGLKLIRRK